MSSETATATATEAETKLAPVEGHKSESLFLRGTLAEEFADPNLDHISDANKSLIKFHGSYQQEDQLLSHALTIVPPAMDQPALADAAADIYPRFTWGIYPQLRQALFDPNRPLGIQMVAAVGGVVCDAAENVCIFVARDAWQGAVAFVEHSYGCHKFEI